MTDPDYDATHRMGGPAGLPLAPRAFQRQPLFDFEEANDENPPSTAHRGARRVNPAIRALIPPLLTREEALRFAHDDDRLRAIAATGRVHFATPRGVTTIHASLLADLPIGAKPVRRIGSHPGARNRVAMHPHVTDRGPLLLVTESMGELGWLRYFEFQPEVTFMQTQWAMFVWTIGDRALYRVPDLLVRDATGWMSCDVRPNCLRDPYFLMMMRLTTYTLDLADWRTALLPEMSPRAARNLRAIAHRRWYEPDLALPLKQVRRARPGRIGGVLDIAGWDWRGATCALYLLAHEVNVDLDDRITTGSPLYWPSAVSHSEASWPATWAAA